MPRLRLSSRQVELFLEKKGFVLVRQKGSHRQYLGLVAGFKRYVTVPTGRKVILPGTMSSMVRQSGIDRPVWELEAR